MTVKIGRDINVMMIKSLPLNADFIPIE